MDSTITPEWLCCRPLKGTRSQAEHGPPASPSFHGCHARGTNACLPAPGSWNHFNPGRACFFI
ncbi:MAG: hypothetical protein ACTSUE_27405 [Promethearchaeota archaeon]